MSQLIKCPNCSHEFAVDDAIRLQFDDEFKRREIENQKKFQSELSKIEKEKLRLKEESEALEDKLNRAIKEKISEEKHRIEKENEAVLKKEKASLEQSLLKKITAESDEKIEKMQQEITDQNQKLKKLTNAEAELLKIKRDKENLESELKIQFAKEMEKELDKQTQSIKRLEEEKASIKLEQLNNELNEKNEEIKKHLKTATELEKVKREKENLKEELELEFEKKMETQIQKSKEEIGRFESEKVQNQLQLKEKKISDLLLQLKEAQNKLEYASNKQSGEVKEIELYDFLKSNFIYDKIEHVASGVKGADVLLHIMSPNGKELGTIVFERKETQKFDEKWLSKLKTDQQKAKAMYSILVTRSMPKENEESFCKNGIWIVNNYKDLKLIVENLREAITKYSSALEKQENKGSKMDLLYEYFTGLEFANTMQTMLDNFKLINDSLEKEEELSIKNFAARRKQLQATKSSLIRFWGSVEGIAGDNLNSMMTYLNE